MSKFWNLAFFGGGWHKHFWLVILVKFGIFFHNKFLTYAKYFNVEKNSQNGNFD